ncbi:MAG: hypothetical protein P8183_07070 [Anaerolineae bacterium]
MATVSDFVLAENVIVYTGRMQESAGSVSEWRPFSGGDQLSTLIIDYNDRCKQTFRQALTGLIEEQAEEAIYFINILPLHPQAILPDQEQLWQTKIIIVDLATAQKAPGPLISLIERIADRPHVTHIIQIAKDATIPAQTDIFHSLRYPALSEPPVFHTQPQLETFLEQFLHTYLKAWEGAAQNPFDKSHYVTGNGNPYVRPYRRRFLQSQSETGKAIRFMYRDYHTQLPELVADVRDVALMRHLSPDQTVNLGRAAAIHEFTLIHIINQLDPGIKHWVSVDPIRQSLFEIPVDAPLKLDQIQKTGLLDLSRVVTDQKLPPAIEDALRKLGFVGKVTRVVCFDRPDVCEQLESLEGLVQIRPFSAELPAWLEPSPPVGFSMTETATGLHLGE